MTYVVTARGFVYVEFVVDVFARRIVGWQTSSAPNTGLVLDAPAQSVQARQPAKTSRLIQHTDRGVQYLSIRYTQRLSDWHITPSAERVGSSYDNALAETVIGLFKTEVVRQKRTWPSLAAIELATLDWVDWFNHRRPVGSIGYVRRPRPKPVFMTHSPSQPTRHDSNPRVSDKAGAIQSR